MSKQSYDSLEGLLEGKTRIKANKTGDIVGRARRVANRATEVMVKVTGNAKGPAHVKAHLDYISRNGKVDIENERGDVVKGKDGLKLVHKEWTQDRGKRRANTRDTTNIVLSMPKGTQSKAVKNSARSFAKAQFGDNYQYVFALHEDADHPHVHLTIKNLGFDGKRLHVEKGDPQIWREGFAKELRSHGVQAEATPRAARGVIKKGVKQVIKHIRDKGLTPEVDKAKIRAIVEEFKSAKAGNPLVAKPWEERIKERQQQVRKTWLDAAKGLGDGTNEDKAFAGQILTFVRSMPGMVTERHEMAKALAQQLDRKQSAQGKQDNSKGSERAGDGEHER